jgi:hypothetical protein
MTSRLYDLDELEDPDKQSRISSKMKWRERERERDLYKVYLITVSLSGLVQYEGYFGARGSVVG